MNEKYIITRWDALKLCAIGLMFIDHAGAFYYTDEQWLRGIGRACAPIFLFLAGFAPHYKFNRRLLLLALLLTVSDWLVKGNANTLNILWNIVLVRLLLAWLERRGEVKLKLHEWFIASVPFVFTLLVVQYGPFGLLLGLCGYVYKHKSHYTPETPERFLWAVILFYGMAYAWFSQFTLATTAITAVSLLLMGLLIRWFVRAPTAAIPCTEMLAPALKLCSRHTAIIYVAHLIVLGWLTGKAI